MKFSLRKKAKKVASVALAGALCCTTLFAATVGKKPVDANAEEVNPLTTIWKTAEIGTHTEKGSYNYDTAAKTIAVTGSGTKFDKGSGLDDMFMTYVEAKGTVTISTKVTFSNPSGSSGFAGIVARNNAEDAGSVSAAIYADYANGNHDQIRYGYHKESAGGGASQLLGGTVTQDNIYLKMVLENGKATFYQSTLADFSDVTKPKGQSIEGLDVKTVGFFATNGITATFSETKITSEYEEDGVAYKKVVFDSEMGELIPTFSKSSDYEGPYAANFAFNSSVDGNILKLVSTRGSTPVTDKGDVRGGKSVDYFLFPAIDKNCTVSADVTINSINNGTDKQGVAVGQFAAADAKVGNSKMTASFLQANKNAATQHNYTTSGGSANGGNPKANIVITNGSTYNLAYEKTADGKVYMTTTDASGAVLGTNKGKEPDEAFDLANAYEKLGAGKSVQYGIAISAADVEITNLKLIDADGYIIYDQNDYYKAVGVAPIVTAITKAEVAADRKSIDLEWTAEEGVGNQQFVVQVSKDGGAYTLANNTKVNSFSYVPDTDGTYKFKVYGKAGDSTSIDAAKETADISYIRPLAAPTVTAQGSDTKVDITFTDVDGATKYEIYRKSSLEPDKMIKELTTERSYTDTDVVNEFPYYYYVVAKNDTNSSNPSEAMQALPTQGHTGDYECGADAAKITVTDKSNDTVFDNKAKISVKSDKAGKFNLYVNTNGEAAPQADSTQEGASNAAPVISKTVAADETAVFEFDLVQGRNDVEVIFEAADGKLTRKTFNFVNNPKIDMVVDAAYTGTDGAEVDGYPTYKTVQAAVNAVPAENAEGKTIFIKNGEYNQRLVITSPYVWLLGEDAEKTHIFASVAVTDGTATGMWDRNAVYVDSTADYFSAENLTIENSYPYTNGNDQQADALAIVADSTVCTNVRLVSFQDTLLTDSRVKGEDGNYEMTKQVFNKCYITGNVDFIYGAGSSIFVDCDIVGRYTTYKADGCFTAPRTYAHVPFGMVFEGCRFYAEEGIADGAYRLSRPWGKDASTTLIGCYISSVLRDPAYDDMSGNSYKKARFSEYYTYGEGFKVNNDRPQMDPVSVVNLLTQIETDYDYMNTSYEEMYKVPAAEADYSAVDAAIAEAQALNPADYKNYKAVEDAIAAVVTGYTADRQAEVDAMAQAIKDAIAALEPAEGTSMGDPEAPSTGDAAPILPLALMMILALGVIVFFAGKKRVVK